MPLATPPRASSCQSSARAPQLEPTWEPSHTWDDALAPAAASAPSSAWDRKPGAGASDDVPPAGSPLPCLRWRAPRLPVGAPSGDAETLHANALGSMLEQWRSKLEASKQLSMGRTGRRCGSGNDVYDIWSTIEESRIWDTALLEPAQVCFYFRSSPQCGAATIIAQSFEAISR